MKNMKKRKCFFICLCLCLFFSLVLLACDKKDAKTDTVKKTENSEKKQDEKKAEEIKLPTGDEIAYAFGVIVARTVKEMKMDFNANELKKGFKDANATSFDKKGFQEAEMTLKIAMQEADKKRRAEKLAKANKFLAENKNKDGVLTTESGLQYQILKAGDGKLKPKPNSTVLVNYVGKLMDGTIFDQNTNEGKPAEIQLERVIAGWKEGIQLMTKGAKARLFIPPNLAYGEQGVAQGNKVIIPPNEVLTFDIELVGIKLDSTKKDE